MENILRWFLLPFRVSLLLLLWRVVSWRWGRLCLYGRFWTLRSELILSFGSFRFVSMRGGRGWSSRRGRLCWSRWSFGSAIISRLARIIMVGVITWVWAVSVIIIWDWLLYIVLFIYGGYGWVKRSIYALDHSLHSLLTFWFEELLFVDIGIGVAYVIDEFFQYW